MTNINRLKVSAVRRIFTLLASACLVGSFTISAGNTLPAEMLYTTSLQQTKTVTGVVSDDTGEPLAGVSVSVKGTNIGVITDANGHYSIQVKDDSQILQFSYLGYKTATETANRSAIDIRLLEDTMALEEVVVTALGIKKDKKALGYSVQEIKSDELIKIKTANPLNSLAGKIAGVNITQSSGSAGSGAQIILRGGTSLERDNQPVFVVDGVIFDNSTSVVGNSGFDGLTGVATTASNRVMDINPEDIENMSVLKGPAAAALYGSRAAAGVIIITTKKGKEGTVSVDVSSKLATSWANRFPEQQSAYKRGKYELSGNRTVKTMNSWGEPFAAGETIYNNIEDFFQNGSVWDNNVSVSGGNQNGSFFLSASNFNQKGIVPTTGYDKTTLRFNGEQKYGKLTVGANVAYSLANTDKTLTSQGLYNSSGNGAMGSTYIWPRSENMQKYLNEDGTKYRNQDYNTNMADDTENPYWILNKNKLSDNTERFTGSINFDFKITDWWNVSYRLGTDSYTTGNRTLIHSGGAIKALYQNGLLSENELKYRYISSNVMTSLNKTFGDFDLGLLLGSATEDTKRETNRRMGYGFPNDFYSFSVVVDANKQFVQLHSQKRMVSAYGEFRISYKNFAYFTVTERNDNTSTLPKENRSYWYPSFSGSLLFSELLPKNDILSFGKIRASYASVGKDADPYVTNTRLQAYQEFTDGKVGVYNITDPRGNPNLKPEITKSTELGLEMRFLNGRIGFDYTYYTNNSYNQLLYPRLSQSPGYYMICVNGGDLYNKGMELSITGQPVKTKDFTWDATINLAGNRGTVGNLFAGSDILYVTDVQVGNAKAASFNDGVFMGISGSKWERTSDGRVILDDTGMPISDGKTTYNIGNREPKLTGGFNNSLQYKDWNLSFLLDFRVGGHVYNGTDYEMTIAGISKRTEGREKLTVTGAVKTGGTTEAPTYDTKTFTFDASTPAGELAIQRYWAEYYTKESANFMTEVNWLRLRSVSLSYNMPKKLLSKTGFIKGCTFTASGDNLLLFTNYKGMDPETSAAGSGVTGSSSVGIDLYGVPATAGMSFGVTLKF